LFKVARSNAACAGVIADITSERAGSTSSLQALDEALREILNEQCVPRQAFENAARGFILHARRQIELEEQNLFPLAESALVDAEWQGLRARLRDENLSLRTPQIKERLRDKRRWIVREESADQAARKAASVAAVGKKSALP
jgi:hemerythrin-like domain-containing protein